MNQMSNIHQTTPTYYEPDTIEGSKDQHRLRVLIDEIATTRGLTIQMSLRIMSLAATPDTETHNDIRHEFAGMAAQFGTNMDLLYGTGPHQELPQDQVDWIRQIAARAPDRRDRMKSVRSRVTDTMHRFTKDADVSFSEARRFFETNWPIVRDDMTAMIWDLWADLDSQKNNALSDMEKLHQTLGITLGDIKKISLAVRMIALNTAVMAARAGDAGKGFSIIATEVRQLAEQIQSSADRADKVVRAMNTDTKD